MNKDIVCMLTLAAALIIFSPAKASEMTSNPIEPCPDSPNCVSSLEQNQDSYIEPIHYKGQLETAMNRLKSILKSTDNALITESNEHMIRAEFRTKLFKFVDDVVFLADETTQTIHMRSASRVGYWDFGANRKRLETIRKSFQEASENEGN